MSLLASMGDGAVVAKRNLIKIKRVPELLVFTTLQPIMFIVLFAYVFGGAISGADGGKSYREFLMAGIFAQTVVFGATITGSALADDIQKGIIDRFRSLPMAQGSVLVGRTLSDVANNVLVVIVMALTGLAVGWRIHTSVLEGLAGFVMLLLFAYAFSWVMAYVGLLAPSPEVVNSASFIVIFPITFVADTFVPVDTLPSVLRHFAEWNPVSTVTRSSRELWGNIPAADPAPHGWPLNHPVAYTLIWVALLLAIFVPLATRQYRLAASR